MKQKAETRLMLLGFDNSVCQKNLARFSNELSLIKDSALRHWTMLKLIYDTKPYFWTGPASSTKKYHPAFANRRHGLVNHTKALVKVLTVFERARPDINWDNLYSAALLHDACKYESDDGKSRELHTSKDHAQMEFIKLTMASGSLSVSGPYPAAYCPAKYADVLNGEDVKVTEAVTYHQAAEIASLIRTHMGRFDGLSDVSAMSEPQWILHYADMLVSQTWYGTDSVYIDSAAGAEK